MDTSNKKKRGGKERSHHIEKGYEKRQPLSQGGTSNGAEDVSGDHQNGMPVEDLPVRVIGAVKVGGEAAARAKAIKQCPINRGVRMKIATATARSQNPKEYCS